MSDCKISVYYRADDAVPDVFQYAQLIDDNPAILIITESLNSYGSKRVTRIPWDRIDHVETTPR